MKQENIIKLNKEKYSKEDFTSSEIKEFNYIRFYTILKEDGLMELEFHYELNSDSVPPGTTYQNLPQTNIVLNFWEAHEYVNNPETGTITMDFKEQTKIIDAEVNNENVYGGIFRIQNIRPYDYDEGKQDKWYYGNITGETGSFFINAIFEGWTGTENIEILASYKSPNDTTYGLEPERWYEVVNNKKA